MLFLSPVYPTRSHPGRMPLTRMRAAALLRLATVPVIDRGPFIVVQVYSWQPALARTFQQFIFGTEMMWALTPGDDLHKWVDVMLEVFWKGAAEEVAEEVKAPPAPENKSLAGYRDSFSAMGLGLLMLPIALSGKALFAPGVLGQYVASLGLLLA